jgi:hypothetical protein
MGRGRFFAGDADYLPSAATSPFQVTLEEDTLMSKKASPGFTARLVITRG